FRVRAVAGGTATTSSAPITVVTLPAAPVATAATSIATLAFTANWGAVTGAAKYRLDVSTVSNFASFVSRYQDLDVTHVTSFAVNTNLAAGTTYYYRVRAENADGVAGTGGAAHV